MYSRISRDKMLLLMAEALSHRSTCSRLQVGAVASIDGRVISTGYNGAPSGLPHCKHSDDSPCETSVHAEANLVAFAAKHGVSLLGSTVHTTHSPCKKCAELLINSGVKTVCYLAPFRDFAGVNLLNAAGVSVYSWSPDE